MDFVLSDLTEAGDMERILMETQVLGHINNEDVVFFIDRNSYNFPLDNLLRDYNEIRSSSNSFTGVRCYAQLA